MIIVYGLGNNEAKYVATKHNVGRIITEKWAQKNDCLFQPKDGYYYTKSNDIAFLYSSEYMNTSGKPLSQFLSFFKYSAQNSTLIIVQDDSDQLEGAVKLVKGGRSAGHKGIDDVYRHVASFGFGPADIWRLKIGIRPEQKEGQPWVRSETFVLLPISEIDKKTCLHLSDQLFNHQKQVIEANYSYLQNRLNR